MRDAYLRELESLDQEIVRMGALVEQSVQMVTTALIEADKDLAQKVRDGDQQVDETVLDIEKRCLVILAQQAPVAGDLRLVVAILRIVGDLERAGDLAYNIAKLVQLDDFREPSVKPVRGLVAELGRASASLLGKAIDAWATKDESLAVDLALQDNKLDELHAELIRRLIDLDGEENIGPALRLAMVGRYLERIGDHAVNLGDRVRYFITGDAEFLT
jgi:phosphate transport system protein